MQSESLDRVPPIGRNVIDCAGAELIERWILQMAVDQVAGRTEQEQAR